MLDAGYWINRRVPMVVSKISRNQKPGSASADSGFPHNHLISKPNISYYDKGGIGYLLHNFYNGCENIFRSIACFFENDLGPQS